MQRPVASGASIPRASGRALAGSGKLFGVFRCGELQSIEAEATRYEGGRSQFDEFVPEGWELKHIRKRSSPGNIKRFCGSPGPGIMITTVEVAADPLCDCPNSWEALPWPGPPRPPILHVPEGCNANRADVGGRDCATGVKDAALR